MLLEFLMPQVTFTTTNKTYKLFRGKVNISGDVALHISASFTGAEVYCVALLSICPHDYKDLSPLTVMMTVTLKTVTPFTKRHKVSQQLLNGDM